MTILNFRYFCQCHDYQHHSDYHIWKVWLVRNLRIKTSYHDFAWFHPYLCLLKECNTYCKVMQHFRQYGENNFVVKFISIKNAVIIFIDSVINILGNFGKYAISHGSMIFYLKRRTDLQSSIYNIRIAHYFIRNIPGQSFEHRFA